MKNSPQVKSPAWGQSYRDLIVFFSRSKRKVKSSDLTVKNRRILKYIHRLWLRPQRSFEGARARPHGSRENRDLYLRICQAAEDGPFLRGVGAVLGGLDRQDGEENAASSQLAAHAHRATLAFDDALGESQSESRARARPHAFELLEIAEEPGNVGLLNPRSVIFHLDAKRVLAFAKRAHLNGAALSGELDGIREVVVHHLFEARGVGNDLADFAGLDRDRNVFFVREYTQHIAHLA